MKSFFTKIGRFFWSRGFLIFFLLVIATTILLYIEENWRGTHAWATAKAEWEAKGESFDRTKFVPLPVPDDQNLAALRLFKQEVVPNDDNGTNYLLDVTLRHAMRDDLSQIESPKLGNPLTGELPDMVALRKSMTANYALAFKRAIPPEDILAQFNAVYPFFNDFVSAAQTRSLLRLNGDYLMPLPAARPLGPLVDLIKLAKILTLHAIFAEDQHRSDLALMDIEINLKLANGASRDPSMVGGLVAVGIVAINRAAIYNGIAEHAWNDAQLVELESILKTLDFLADYQFTMRAEAVNGTTLMDFLEHTNKTELERNLGRGARESPLMEIIGYPWPSGWWDNNKKVIATFDLTGVDVVDSKAHLAYPKRAEQLKISPSKREPRGVEWHHGILSA